MSNRPQASGPVEASSAEAVAFRLMEKIASCEANTKTGDNQHSRDYWLTLYIQCRRATARGVTAESALQSK
jgi:hypothetical protein